MYTLVYLRIHEKTKKSSHDDYSMDQHPPQGGGKQQQHDDTVNMVWHFINEEISVTTRKRLEKEAMSYQPDEQQSSQLSPSFDF